MRRIFLFFGLMLPLFLSAQEDYFPYILKVNPVEIPNLPGLHSYAFAQHEGKWLVIGGRKDGLHARQPNASFPANFNNTEIFVIDVKAKRYWMAPLDPLPVNLREQLQSTNMNFYQDGSKLLIIGGYGYSASKNNHITYPFVTYVEVPDLIDAVINQRDINPFFFQIPDERFAVTGGQLGKIGDTYFLIGGHRFDGRYNPMGGPSFTQTYTNQIKKFKLAPSIGPIGIIDYEEITDPVHLRRRDYNLVPQIFPDGSEGYMVSSGVFQINADLPFLYPIDITADRYLPKTEFNQYLSNYHAPKVGLHDSERNQMHALFFGGMSQYYYQLGELVQDNRIPFTKNISRVSRYPDGSLLEFLMPVEMPFLETASAEFIINNDLPRYSNQVIKLNEIEPEEFLIGHILGGIASPTRNPFTDNQTNTTSAAAKIYEVKLIKSPIASIPAVDGSNPYVISVFPNPFRDRVFVQFHTDKQIKIDYFISTPAGQLIDKGSFFSTQIGKNEKRIDLGPQVQTPVLLITFVFEDKFYVTKKLISN
ncbi:hypothetical protein [Cecembia calidifontis]|uniref:Uncharacterized protein n=1 Tax=Cecembia calidifontis TaxID=1187080 RepID=A0A4Q7PAH1_9BACT|nr:hypothetical protein [Cecembia calidifontis]RZS97263.1 hypothetical protein BC751_2866 [Cecembia calidifontis]